MILKNHLPCVLVQKNQYISLLLGELLHERLLFDCCFLLSTGVVQEGPPCLYLFLFEFLLGMALSVMIFEIVSLLKDLLAYLASITLLLLDVL